MDMDEIKDNADMAETYPDSGKLNWQEIEFATLAAWVELNPQQKTADTATFDIESVKGMFEAWWRTTRTSKISTEQQQGEAI